MKPSPFLILCLTFFAIVVYGQAQTVRFNAKIGYQVFDVLSQGQLLRVCKGGNILFSDNSSGNISSVNWRFDGGSPSVGAGTVPLNVSYGSAGIFRAVETIVFSGGMIDSLPVTVIVTEKSPSLMADFNILAGIGACANQLSVFQNISKGNAVFFHWDFGDGDSSLSKDTSHRFTRAVGTNGTEEYTVTLTIADAAGCQDSSSNPITVKRIPGIALASADFDIDTGTFNGIKTFRYCDSLASHIFSFRNISTTTNTDYLVTWGSTFPPPDTTLPSWTTDTISHRYPLGMKTMTVAATNENGCRTTQAYNVFLGSSPSGNLINEGNYSFCVGETIPIRVDPGIRRNPLGTKYVFHVDDGSKDTTYENVPDTIHHTFYKSSCGINGNTFTATLTMENPCNSNFPQPTSVPSISVSSKPAADFKISPDSVICAGSTVELHNLSDFGSVVTGGQCNRNGYVAWRVFPDTGVLITGNVGQFRLPVANLANWTAPGGDTLLQMQFPHPGKWTIRLYAINTKTGKCAFIDSVDHTICVQERPAAKFDISGLNAPACNSDTISVKTVPVLKQCKEISYTWTTTNESGPDCSQDSLPSLLNGAGNAMQVQILLPQPGLYRIQLKVAASEACWDTVSKPVIIKGKPHSVMSPISSICLSGTASFSADTARCQLIAAETYAWTTPGGSPSAGTAWQLDSVRYAATGWHYVTLTQTNSCGVDAVLDSILITDRPPADAGRDTSMCGADTLLLGGPAGSFNYEWFPALGLNSTTDANPLFHYEVDRDTMVKVFVRVSAGPDCESLDSVSIRIKPSPALKILPLERNICKGDSLELHISGAASYTWTGPFLHPLSGASVSAKPDTTSVYTVTGTLDGCSTDSSFVITVNGASEASFTVTNGQSCAGTDLKNIIVTQLAAQGTFYRYYVNDTLVSSNTTGEFPTRLLNVGEVLVIKLVTINPAGCLPDSDIHEVHVAVTPAAHFSKSADRGCGPLKVKFSVLSDSAQVLQFSWDFGNGQTSSAASPDSVSYPASLHDTTYYILAAAFNSCDTLKWKDSVFVLARPFAGFYADPDNGCSRLKVTIHNNSSIHSFFQWDFGDGGSKADSSLSNFIHEYTTDTFAVYRVLLTAINRCGTDTDSTFVRVSPNAIRPFITLDGNQAAGCASHEILLKNATVGAAYGVAYFGDGADSVIFPGNQKFIPHTYELPGDYTILVNFYNDCSVNTGSVKLKVYPRPVAAFSIDSSRCAATELFTLNHSASANAYNWLWGDGDQSPGANGQHRYDVPGSYTVALVAMLLNGTGVVCSDTTHQLVTLLPPLIADSITVDGLSCTGHNLTFQTLMGNQLTWTFYDMAHPLGQEVTGNPVSHLYDQAGDYVVKAALVSDAGCRDSTLKPVTIFPTPIMVQGPSDTAYCLMDTTLIFTAKATYPGSDALTFAWSVNDVPSWKGNPFVFHANSSSPKTYAISVSVSNSAGCTNSEAFTTVSLALLAPVAIAVSPSLEIFQPADTFGFSDTATRSGALGYLWDFGDHTGRQSREPFPSYTFGDTGYYKVTLVLKDLNAGCAVTGFVRVHIVGVRGFLSVPNAFCPGCDKPELRTFLPIGDGLLDYRLRILTKTGQLVFESNKLVDGKPSVGWNGHWGNDAGKKELPQGAYYWEISAHYINGTEWQGMRFKDRSYVKSGFVDIIR